MAPQLSRVNEDLLSFISIFWVIITAYGICYMRALLVWVMFIIAGKKKAPVLEAAVSVLGVKLKRG